MNDCQVRRVNPDHEEYLLEHLSKDPRSNAYLLGLVHDYGIRGLADMNWGYFYHCFGRPDWHGCMYHDAGGLLMVPSADLVACEAFAAFISNEGLGINKLLAPIEVGHLLHDCLIDRSPKWQRITNRFDEYGMVVSSQRLSSLTEDGLRPARRQELEVITQGTMSAMQEELGVDFRDGDYEKLRRSRRDLIRRKRYYVLQNQEDIVYQAYVSTLTPSVAQIQGVWVPPNYRNQGVAAKCTTEVARRCLEESREVVLTVQARNVPAVHAYRNAGFECFGEFVAIWFRKTFG